MKNKLQIFSALVVLLFSLHAQAETMYVTDRILLGVHQQPNENSPIVATIPSGTALTVIQRQDSFSRIRLADGKEGWVSASYLKKEKPATAELDTVYAKLQKEQESSKKLAADLGKKERDLQLLRDELSNAKTTIKDLKSKASNTTAAPAPPPANDEELKKANETIAQLETKISELETQVAEQPEQEAQPEVANLQKLELENRALQGRIEAALANLQGETVPSAEELAAIRPSFPVWYWLLLIALLIIGVGGGFFLFDYLHRQKHGGFRI